VNVLLIAANTEQLNMPVLPLGLAWVAASAEAAGHDVRTVNLMTATDIRPPLAAAVAGFGPDMIGISVRNIDDQVMAAPHFLLRSVRPVVSECRRIADVPIVLGGPGYSIFPDSALSYLGADIGIVGDGEVTFTALLDRMAREADLEDLPGICLPDGRSAPARLNRRLGDLPLPLPGHHLPFTREVAERDDLWVPFQTRRGCPMNCTYCATAAIEGRPVRKIPPERAVDGLERFVAAGFSRFFFVDNIFNLPPRHAEALCDEILSRGLDIRWRCILYPAHLSERLAQKMAEAGCEQAALGCESGAPEVLRQLNKRFDPETVSTVSDRLRRHGIQRMGFLLLGGPGETRETVLQSLRFMEGLETEMVKVTTGIRIYPKTELARIAVREGIIDPADSLLEPRFYLARGMEEWLEETAGDWMANRPHWMG
jgi:radical SAM superfamily enzyme YgiQ (UPF0313 family)